MKQPPKNSKRILLKNKKAYHDYTILETFEAGIVLRGTEVKSLRAQKAQMQDSYAYIKGNEVFLSGLLIEKYSHGNIHNHPEKRTRKLLMHKKEILKLKQKTQEKLTLIPLQIHLTNNLCKVMIGLARGKKVYDKRQQEKEKTDKRSIERAMKS